MVELRKRKAATATAPLPNKKANSVKSISGGKKDESPVQSTASSYPASGETVELDGFGGEVETQEGISTTLKKLVDDSKRGVVLFTYPKASTPGCTTQACMFRDEFDDLTATGYSIYGLSNDSPKSNSNFKSKQKLPFTLLCDPAAKLIKAIGMKKTPSGTIRGVFVVDKEGKVEAAPAATVAVVRELVAAGSEATQDASKTTGEGEANDDKGQDDVAITDNGQPVSTSGPDNKAEVAAEVADTAQALDDGTN